VGLIGFLRLEELASIPTGLSFFLLLPPSDSYVRKKLERRRVEKLITLPENNNF